MSNVPLTDDEIKAMLRGVPQHIHGTARLVALLQKCGVTDTTELSELCCVSRRMVQMAAKSLSPPAKQTSPSSEADFAEAKNTSPKAKRISPSEADFAPRVHARAHFELPSEVSPLKEVEDSPTPSVSPQAEKPKRNGTRLPADWQLPDDWRQWARMNFAAVAAETIQFEADRFADYWHAKTGRGSTMLDWQATWRNWCRKAFGAPGKGPQPINWGRSAYDQRERADGGIRGAIARHRAAQAAGGTVQ